MMGIISWALRSVSMTGLPNDASRPNVAARNNSLLLYGPHIVSL
jgi:hypothetical protein